MRVFTHAFKAELAAGRLCRAVKITPREDMPFGVTNHDRPLTFGGLTYDPYPGELGGRYRSRVGTSIDNERLAGSWGHPDISEQQALDGEFDEAVIEMLVVAWALEPPEAVTVFRGEIGKLSWHRDGFVTEVMENLRRLGEHLGGTFGPRCEAVLGDSRCQVNLSALQVSGTVTAVAFSRTTFTDTSRTEAAEHWTDGLVIFTSGALAGKRCVVESFAAGQFRLMLPTPADIAVSMSYTATPGCDHRLEGDCAGKFNNAVNFQGFPFIRGETQVAGEANP